jgi:hypothetical protein
MKYFLLLLSLTCSLAWAESPCDIRMGNSVGVKVLEFASGNVVHSKMALRETTPKAIEEEMISLQDMGICSEKIQAKKCILRLEKQQKQNILTFYRDNQKWGSWTLASKTKAQDFVKHLKQFGFCS